MNLSRRTFLESLGTTMVATALPAQKIIIQKQGYKPWFEQNIKHTDQVNRHPELTHPYKATEKQIEIMKKTFTQHGPQVEIESIHFETSTSFNPFISPQATWDEYLKRQAEAVKKLFAIAGMSDKAFTVNIEVLRSETKIRYPKKGDTAIPVYVADAFFLPSIRANIQPKRTEKPESQLVYAINIVRPIFSGFQENYGASPEDTSFSPIFISCKNSLDSYLSLPEELLHWNLRQTTYAQERKNVKNIEMATKYEEGLVHAVSKHFAEKTREAEGFTQKDIERRYEEGSKNERYAKIPAAYHFLSKGTITEQFRKLAEDYTLMDK